MSPLKQALKAAQQKRPSLAVARQTTEPIATHRHGLSFSRPGPTRPEAFWQLLRNGVDGGHRNARDRWDLDDLL